MRKKKFFAQKLFTYSFYMLGHLYPKKKYQETYVKSYFIYTYAMYMYRKVIFLKPSKSFFHFKIKV